MFVGPLIAIAPAEVMLSADATAGAAASLREQLRNWLSGRVVTSEVVSDIMIGVNEALANCVDHAYAERPRPGKMIVKAAIDETVGSINIWIIDDGTWRQPQTRSQYDSRGRGIPLMQALADDCIIHGRADGTTVCLRYRC